MAINFTADEIFEMAEFIEESGAKFYRQAAQNNSDPKRKEMFLKLAAMEDNHLVIFKTMRRQLNAEEKAQDTFDPDNEAAMYLQTMAGAHGWEGKLSPAKELTGKESFKEVLQIALNAEKDSVIFYFGLRSFITPKAGKDKLDAIIKEEINHITVLNQQLSASK
jgi:rubrerythrin